MPIAATDLFARVGLKITGTAQWGTPVLCNDPGVYAVCLSHDPAINGGLLSAAPISAAAVARWVELVPTFRYDGQQPKPAAVVAHLASFWLADENVLYVGKATCLRERLRQFHTHSLGRRSPHKGGHWLKTLSNLDGTHLFFCRCTSAAEAEQKEQTALLAFAAQVSSSAKARLGNPAVPIPFANLKLPPSTLKQSRIRGDVIR